MPGRSHLCGKDLDRRSTITTQVDRIPAPPLPLSAPPLQPATGTFGSTEEAEPCARPVTNKRTHDWSPSENAYRTSSSARSAPPHTHAHTHTHLLSCRPPPSRISPSPTKQTLAREHAKSATFRHLRYLRRDLACLPNPPRHASAIPAASSHPLDSYLSAADGRPCCGISTEHS
ncbi:uncharacterized protein LY79DRAFT_302739 [Colletotrichum navitas]|uniref:Uncharacterized protein n=1 Tax=Colletotrichum navitas TaxID=681940 RepID=A0AAD8V3A3_9PEZI|nr:uncharacterized protein LY79DRAFT_302739 [Colletotrichum navitas]KAK1580523.1 hypothetical protein LY79DRAFT_302739 [Colletotrichum navitas]